MDFMFFETKRQAEKYAYEITDGTAQVISIYCPDHPLSNKSGKVHIILMGNKLDKFVRDDGGIR